MLGRCCFQPQGRQHTCTAAQGVGTVAGLASKGWTLDFGHAWHVMPYSLLLTLADAAADAAADALVQKALQAGTSDNVTALLMLIEWQH